jgi:hypothetical protein
MEELPGWVTVGWGLFVLGMLAHISTSLDKIAKALDRKEPPEGE